MDTLSFMFVWLVYSISKGQSTEVFMKKHSFEITKYPPLERQGGSLRKRTNHLRAFGIWHFL